MHTWKPEELVITSDDWKLISGFVHISNPESVITPTDWHPIFQNLIQHKEALTQKMYASRTNWFMTYQKEERQELAKEIEKKAEAVHRLEELVEKLSVIHNFYYLPPGVVEDNEGES